MNQEIEQLKAQLATAEAERDTWRRSYERQVAANNDIRTADFQRAEAAEARVRELEDGISAVLEGRVTLAPPAIIHDLRCAYTDRTAERNEHRVQRENAEARLAAVLGSVKRFTEAHGKIRWGYDGDCGSNSLVETLELAIDIDAARTGDAAHPDSVSVGEITPNIRALASRIIDRVIDGETRAYSIAEMIVAGIPDRTGDAAREEGSK